LTRGALWPWRRWPPGLTSVIVFGGLLAIVIAVVVIAALRDQPLYPGSSDRPDIPFRRAAWLAHPATPADDTRGRMSKDLLRHHLARGMPRGAVVRLLGAPDFATRNRIEYDIGSAQDFLGGTVIIRFEARDRLFSARRVERGGF
jgi:hypothetical protein